MYRFFISCFLFQFLFISTSLTAQRYTDSLQQKSYDELESMFFVIRETDSIKAKKIAGYYLKRAKYNTDTLKIAKGLDLLSTILNQEEQQKYLDSIILITKNKQNKEYPAKVYLKKAQFFLFEKRNIKKALDNLSKAKILAKENFNTKLLYRIKYYIGIVKSEHLGEKDKAIQIFKDCAEFYKNKDEYIFRYLYTLHAISETYISLKEYDSTTYYNNLGYNKTYKSTNSDINVMKTYFILCEGINQYNRKKYIASIDSINKTLPQFIKIGDLSNTIDSYFYLGKSYHDLNNTKKAILYFNKTDSILNTLKSIPQYKHVKTYEYLKDYYKQINDLQNQNKYLDKLNSILNKYLNDQMLISRKVKEDYDIPILIEEQEAVIKKLNKNTNTYISGLLILGILLFISGGLIYYQYRKKRLYKIRFEQLIINSKSSSHTANSNQVSKITKKIDVKVPEKHVTYILSKLDEFEENRLFLNVGVSSQSLANDMETNVKYLSQVINHYKNKSFTNYLNELRITHAVKELQENVMLQKFTIKAIANEFGYNNAETFSNAFYKQVKIKPSYFIKELRKNI
jgi:AraC-like DNA-binding protein